MYEICTWNESILFISYVSKHYQENYCPPYLSLFFSTNAVVISVFEVGRNMILSDVHILHHQDFFRERSKEKGNYISSVKMRSGQLKRIYRKMRFFFVLVTWHGNNVPWGMEFPGE